jgi:hypothetical protein
MAEPVISDLAQLPARRAYRPGRTRISILIKFTAVKPSEEQLLTRLSLEEVLTLLGVQGIPGTAGQLERLRRWIESVVDKRGSAFVRQNRQNLLRLWDLHMKVKSKSCC